ncbi:gliding motility-associated C-terminal domain-containing protein, partial [Salegentibacter holothuriorum]
TGTISVTTEAGISYTLLDENQNALNNSIANGEFSGLDAGTYFVQASNGDCEASSEALVIIKNLGTPGQPQASVSQQPSCEDTTGTISVTTEQGISYTLLDENNNPLTNNIANGEFSGLSDGTYFVQASNGDCEAVSEALVIIENLGTPNQPQASISQQPTCEDTTGTISVTTEAGISYTLLDENQNPLTNSIANGEFSGLDAGKYFVQASNGDCEAVSEALVIIENLGAPIAPVITSITNTTCSLNNGIIEFELTGGLSYVLRDNGQNEYSHENGSFTDLASGVYYLVAKNNDCESEVEVIVEADQDVEAPEIISCPIDLINVTVDEGTCTASQLSLGDLIAKDNCDSELSITNNAPELFSLGETIVIWTVTDAAGNESTCTQTVTVTDNQIPVIDAVEAINTTADANTCGAMIEITAPLASDNCSVGIVSGTRDDNQALDAEYPVGTTTITWTVTDDNGNEAEPVLQTVTVTDNQAPVIAEVENINTTADANTCGAMIEITAPLASDNCSVGIVSGTRDDNQALDVEYPVGTTTITWIVSDDNGNKAEPVIQTVTVTDNQAPVIAEVENISTTADADTCGAMIEITGPLASDNCSVGMVTGTRDDNQALDVEYPVGTTTITWIVSDDNGNEAEPVLQTVTVTDDQAPVIAEQENITVNTDPDSCGAIVNYTIPSASDNCGIENIELTEGLAPGSEFPLGETSLTYTATDLNGNTVNSSFIVSVIDNQAPVIACPEDIQLNVEFGTTAVVVDYDAISATDNCSETSIELIEGFASGEEFPVGETRVTYEVTDASGNSVSCSFVVIVEEDPEETPPAPTVPQVDLIQPDCVTPTGVILINTENGLTYSIDGEVYEAVEEFTELEPGTYQVTAKDDFDQISEATEVILEEPVASEIETRSISLCLEDTSFNLFELLEGEYDDSGVWIDTEETGALTQDFIDPAMLQVGTYTFQYELNNGICSSTTEVTVNINDDCIVLPCSLDDIQSSISKAVTPNGDNRNDFFSIDFAGECGFTYDLMIFNRWGNKIYEATNYQNDWDGYSSNSATSSNQLPSGTYFYILEINNSGFEPIQGYIYLGTK